jgi:hypothetical protein
MSLSEFPSFFLVIAVMIWIIPGSIAAGGMAVALRCAANEIGRSVLFRFWLSWAAAVTIGGGVGLVAGELFQEVTSPYLDGVVVGSLADEAPFFVALVVFGLSMGAIGGYFTHALIPSASDDDPRRVAS